MASVKAHYDDHLGSFYSWMAGDFSEKQAEHLQFLADHQIIPHTTGIAIDLGAGHGIQSVSVAKLGFKVKAIDFNRQLLNELEENSKGLAIDIIEDDILNLKRYADPKPEIIICWGDTLTHLADLETIECFLADCADFLAPGGKLILSFRDYTAELTGDARFIPVKSDEKRILTCFLEYFPQHVRVTDILYEKRDNGWHQKISSYEKVRIAPEVVKAQLAANNLQIIFEGTVSRLTTIIAKKK